LEAAEGETSDAKPFYERFAAAACGTSGTGVSGFTRLNDVRKKARVAKEYDTLQAYQCDTCLTHLSAQLAVRPSTEAARTFRAGPHVQNACGGGTLENLHVCYTADHAKRFEQAGYVQVNMLYHMPAPWMLMGCNTHLPTTLNHSADILSAVTVF